MAVTTSDYPPKSKATPIPWRRVLAGAAQLASWATTFWFVQFVWPEGAAPYQALIAIAVEALFVVMKERLFRGDDPTIGWVGFVLDAVVNAGGILPKSCRVLAFPPIAALLTAFGLTGACQVYSVPSVAFALLCGALLSVLPHRLWR